MHLLCGLLALCAPPSPWEDPTTALVTALESHPVVALGENHGHAEFHHWLVSALEDPRVSSLVDDVAVEWGNALYQDVVDRYVAGEDVPWDSVTMAWRNTIVSPNTVWDAPQYEAFFRHVRRINAGLPTSDRYRVLLVDSPIEWRQVHTRADAAPHFDRARAMADVIRRRSLSLGRTSLFVAGGLHVSKRNRVHTNRYGVPTSEITPVAWLQFYHPDAVFSFQSLARDGQLAEFPVEAPTEVATVWSTSAPELREVEAGQLTTLRNRDGSIPNVYGSARLPDVVDAVILWPTRARTFQEPAPDAFLVDWYWTELDRRSHIMRGRPMDPSLRRPTGAAFRP